MSEDEPDSLAGLPFRLCEEGACKRTGVIMLKRPILYKEVKVCVRHAYKLLSTRRWKYVGMLKRVKFDPWAV